MSLLMCSLAAVFAGHKPSQGCSVINRLDDCGTACECRHPEDVRRTLSRVPNMVSALPHRWICPVFLQNLLIEKVGESVLHGLAGRDPLAPFFLPPSATQKYREEQMKEQAQAQKALSAKTLPKLLRQAAEQDYLCYNLVSFGAAKDPRRTLYAFYHAGSGNEVFVWAKDGALDRCETFTDDAASWLALSTFYSEGQGLGERGFVTWQELLPLPAASAKPQ